MTNTANKRDQYGKEVPSDLVLLDNEWLNICTSKEISNLNRLDWYVIDTKPINRFIFASLSQLEPCLKGLVDFIFPSDIGIKDVNWLKVDSCLHRYSVEDGWYHA